MIFNPFVCMGGSFNHGDQEDTPDAPWSPRRTKRCKNNASNKMNKNPFSTRGLEKFAMVLSDLDVRRQKIYEQMGLRDDDQYSLVRFGYSSSKGNWVPIVIKLKSLQQRDQAARDDTKGVQGNTGDHHHHHEQVIKDDVEQHNVKKKDQVEGGAKSKRFAAMMTTPMSFIVDILSLLMKRSPYYRFAFVVILILVCLVILGRSFAIICASVLWYLVPTIKENQEFNHLRRRSVKKKDFIKKLSDTDEMMMRSTPVNTPKGKNLRHGLSRRRNA